MQQAPSDSDDVLEAMAEDQRRTQEFAKQNPFYQAILTAGYRLSRFSVPPPSPPLAADLSPPNDIRKQSITDASKPLIIREASPRTLSLYETSTPPHTGRSLTLLVPACPRTNQPEYLIHLPVHPDDAKEQQQQRDAEKPPRLRIQHSLSSPIRSRVRGEESSHHHEIFVMDMSSSDSRPSTPSSPSARRTSSSSSLSSSNGSNCRFDAAQHIETRPPRHKTPTRFTLNENRV